MATKKFCIIGLGYFGLNLSIKLAEAGAEVIAIDKNTDRVELLADQPVYAACMDSTDIKALRSLGLKDMDAVIVAIGEGFESSILTSAALQEIGVTKIYNRVISMVHEKLLKLMNIQELLVPEAEAAQHLAKRLMISGLVESFEIHKDYGIFEIVAPKNFINKSILDINLRQTYHFNLITIKRLISKSGLLSFGQKEEIEVLGVPEPNTIIRDNDILVLFGKEKDIKILLGD